MNKTPGQSLPVISDDNPGIRRARLILCAFLSVLGGVGYGAPPPLVETATGRLATEVSINGTPVSLDVDTGTGPTILDLSVRKPLHLATSGRREMFLLNETIRGKITSAVLAVPGYSIPGFTCLLASRDRIAPHAKGDSTRGLLGAGFLSQARAVIDIDKRTITYGSVVAPDGETDDRMLGIPFEYVSDQSGIMVSVRVNGRKTVALVDTGALRTHAFSDVVLPNKVGQLRSDEGVSCTIVDSIEFLNEKQGSIVMKNFIVVLLEHERPAVSENPIGARARVYVGLDLLRLGRARIDFRRNMLYLTKEARSE